MLGDNAEVYANGFTIYGVYAILCATPDCLGLISFRSFSVILEKRNIDRLHINL